MYTYQNYPLSPLSGEYAGNTYSYSKGVVDSNTGVLKLAIEANANIRDLPSEYDYLEPLYRNGNIGQYVNTGITARIDESLSFEVDSKLAGQEIWATFNLFMHGNGFGLSNVIGDLFADNVTRRFVGGTSQYSVRERELYYAPLSNGTVSGLEHQLTMKVLLQGLGENTELTSMDFRTNFTLASHSYQARGNFLNTSNLFIELPEGVTMRAENPGFASNQYIPEWAKTTKVPEPSTLAIFALGLMGLATRRFKKQS